MPRYRFRRLRPVVIADEYVAEFPAAPSDQAMHEATLDRVPISGSERVVDVVGDPDYELLERLPEWERALQVFGR